MSTPSRPAPETRDRSRRVLIIVENLSCPFDRRVWQEALALKADGYVVSIICPKGWGYTSSYELLDGIHIHRHPLPFEADSALGYALEYGVSFFWEFVLSLKIALTRGFDVIHACNPPDTIFLIGGFYKLFGKRFIFDHHDVNPELYEAKFQRKDVWYRLLCALERWTFRTADVSIATNDSFRRIAIERGGMPPEDVFVVRSGPDLSKIKSFAPRDDLRKGKRFLVGYVGVIGKQEGIDLLLDSVVYMRDVLKRSDCQFLIIGDGTEVPFLRERTRELGLAECVELPGRVTGDRLWEMLSSADVCVSPDRLNEMNDISTMNKVIEYMALGKPVVQFDLREGRFSAADAALYAKANDAEDFARQICTLLDDPELRSRMGRIGRARVEGELAWSHQVPKLLSAYRKAMDH